MKIKHITGETLDTDTLPDTEAMVLEKVEQFRQFCLDNKVPFIMFIDPKGTESTPFISFWNFANRINNYEVGENEQKKVNMLPIWKALDNFIYHSSAGDLCVTQILKK
jgi:hypothetical protein